MAVIAAVAVAVGAVAWFAFLSPHGSAAMLTANAAHAVPGEPIPITGTVTPATANRVVELSVASGAGGPFTSFGTAVTDAAGRFQASWTPVHAGHMWVRAVALELGRDQQAQSAPTQVTVRTPATLTLKLATTAIRTTTATTVTATVTPTGGAITLEKSADGQTWTALPTTAGKGGNATAKVSRLPGGTWYIRGSAVQTDTASAATGKEVTLLVEDYKAAGAKYLAIVAPGNKAIHKLNSLIDAGASLSTVKKQASVLSKAFTQQAKNFRAYKGWPREVAPVIAELAKAGILDADDFHKRSQSRSVDEWNKQADAANTSTHSGDSAAARARDLLGLPKRNLHP